jgi:hypothetical protein
MERDSLLLQDQASVMDIETGDMWIVLKKRGAIWGHAEVVWLSTHQV